MAIWHSQKLAPWEGNGITDAVAFPSHSLLAAIPIPFLSFSSSHLDRRMEIISKSYYTSEKRKIEVSIDIQKFDCTCHQHHH